MAITYHAGRRIQGTAADRAEVPAISGGWKEVGRTTLGSAGDEINVSSLANKRYYMILGNTDNSGACSNTWRLNSDTGSNYAYRFSEDGATDVTGTSATGGLHGTRSYTVPSFFISFISNLSSKEKLVQSWHTSGNTAGAGTANTRDLAVGKWANTTDAINAIMTRNSGAGDYLSGSETVVLGWDPDDTHTDNFWEELASVELGSAGDNLSSGTISAKKYLWVQCWYENNSASDINVKMRFNNDSGSNYASRYSLNGASDTSRTSKTFIDTQASGGQYPNFVNCFIVNNASNEKLVISNLVGQSTAGAGTAPIRTEIVGKWTNTSNQITEIDFDNVDAGDISAGAILKVWGAD